MAGAFFLADVRHTNMPKRYVIFLVIAFIAGICTLHFWIDHETISSRRLKMNEMIRVSSRFNTERPSIATVLKQLGQPTRIEVSRDSQSLILEYKFTFRGLPWSTPHEVLFQVFFRIDSTFKSSTPFETFG